ncbi:MAG: hypothetical protein IPN17_21765 [Deltaproteobacteria bacterium]|nr:hypothetical protein [Deltaproteobacteria bacterium]
MGLLRARRTCAGSRQSRYSGITGSTGICRSPPDMNTGTERKQICSLESDSISLSTRSLRRPTVMTLAAPATPPSRHRTQRPESARGKTRSSARIFTRSLRQIGQCSLRGSAPLRAKSTVISRRLRSKPQCSQ